MATPPEVATTIGRIATRLARQCLDAGDDPVALVDLTNKALTDLHDVGEMYRSVLPEAQFDPGAVLVCGLLETFRNVHNTKPLSQSTRAYLDQVIKNLSPQF